MLPHIRSKCATYQASTYNTYFMLLNRLIKIRSQLNFTTIMRKQSFIHYNSKLIDFDQGIIFLEVCVPAKCAHILKLKCAEAAPPVS